MAVPNDTAISVLSQPPGMLVPIVTAEQIRAHECMLQRQNESRDRLRHRQSEQGGKMIIITAFSC